MSESLGKQKIWPYLTICIMAELLDSFTGKQTCGSHFRPEVKTNNFLLDFGPLC